MGRRARRAALTDAYEWVLQRNLFFKPDDAAFSSSGDEKLLAERLPEMVLVTVDFNPTPYPEWIKRNIPNGCFPEEWLIIS